MQEILQTALERARPATAKGRCASYIPELTKADPHYLGISIRTTDGRSWHAGDYRVRFTRATCVSFPLVPWSAAERNGHKHGTYH